MKELVSKLNMIESLLKRLVVQNDEMIEVLKTSSDYKRTNNLRSHTGAGMMNEFGEWTSIDRGDL